MGFFAVGGDAVDPYEVLNNYLYIMTNLEVEAKFQIDDLMAVRKRLLNHNAVLKKPRVYEKNTVYDDDQQSLKNSFRLIRLRQDEKIKLTFKGAPPVGTAVSEAKVREEIELEISDFKKMEQIIGRLGYRPVIVYEKYRETFQIDEVEVVLDELPYGNFVELEGSEVAIKSLAKKIEIDWGKRINTNYLMLLEKVKVAYNLDFLDLTFDNFSGVEVDWNQVE
ncbi:MAG: adenylate cyclase class 2 [Cellvibrionaceae bacterium]